MDKNHWTREFNQPLPETMATPASSGARFAAFVIDAIAVSVITGFLKVIEPLAPFASLASFFYYFLCHKQNGQTLGKKILGIHVVSVTGEALTAGQVLRRETLGRMVAAVLLGIGYMRILFNDDRRGWHDTYAGTEVMNVDAIGRRSSVSPWKAIAFSLGGITAAVVVGLAVLLFTPIPLRQAAKDLELRGMTVEKVSGSIARGFSVKRFATKDEKSEVELNDVRFEYDLPAMFIKKEFVIKRISVSSGSVTLLAGNSKKDDIEPLKAVPKENGEKAPDPDKNSFLTSAKIERIDIANLKFSSSYIPGGRVFELKRLFVDQAIARKDAVTIGQVYVECDSFDLNLNALSVSKKKLSIEKMSRVTVKSSVAPGTLLREIAIDGRFDYDLSEKKLKDLVVSAAEGRLQLKKINDALILKTYGYDPRKYFVSAAPLTNLNLELHASWPELNPRLQSGTFSLQSKSFALRTDGKFAHVGADRSFELATEQSALLHVLAPVMPSPGPLFSIIGRERENVEEWLASLYFAKGQAELSAEEQELIAKDASHFRLEQPIINLGALQGAGTSSPASVRAPSSHQSPGVGSPVLADFQQILDLYSKTCAEGNKNACVQLEKIRLNLRQQNLSR